MQLELRKTSDNTCPTCGAHDLVHTQGLPLIEDVSEQFEREFVRRELGLARVFRDHLADLTAETMQRETEREQALQEVRRLLQGLQADVAGWRRWHRRREQEFAARIGAAVDGLLDRSRYPMTPSPHDPGDVDRS